MPAQRIAAIDIGTVTCRLLVADCDGSNVHELHRQSEFVHLGEGVDAAGRINDAALARAEAQIAAYAQTARSYTTEDCPVRIVAVGTSASRDAANAQDLVDAVRAHGVELQVIPGEREAQLSFAGASQGRQGKQILVTDVGGGSTELMVGRAGEAPLMSHSFNVGCRRVTERFLQDDPPTPGQLEQAHAFCVQEFSPFFEELRAQGLRIDEMVSVAGTATTVVSIDQHMEAYDSKRVHGFEVSEQALDRVFGMLAGMTNAQREQVVGLQPQRAPVIVAGVVILQELVKLAGTGSFVACESDILQGMILDAARR